MASPAHATGGPFVLPIDGGLALFAGPRSPMNKVIGFGFDGELDLQELPAIEERWAERGEPVRIELSILSDPAVVATLSERGYRLHGFENVLACRVAGAARRRPRLRRSPSRRSATIPSRNGSPSPSTPSPTWMAAAAPRTRCCRARSSSGCFAKRWGRNRWRGSTRYIARLDGEPAGEAALHIDDGLALLAGSGTVPHLRGRGVQKALVARRLDDARREGCDLAVVVTAPGTRSQENVMRRGFELLYTRAILLR